jgi:hypothetical protein
VATDNQAGVATGVGAGTATITAASEGRSGSAAVTVPTYLLRVSMAGPGNGIVTSSPAEIECPGTCQASFASGVVVTLEALQAVGGGDFFDGWSGACTGAPSTLTSLSGALLSRTHYRVCVSPAAALTELTIKTFGGTGDVDLYVRQGRVPATDLSDCESETFGNADSCTFPNPESGDYYILLYGFVAYSGVTLEVTAATEGGTVPESSPEGSGLKGPRITRIP